MKTRKLCTVIGILAIFVLGLAFIGCGDGEDDNNGTTGSGPTPNPVAPVISAQLPETATYDLNETTVEELTVTAEEPSDGGVLSYQWYRNTANSNEGGTAIDGATEASFTPPTNAKGVFYYYVIVTNTLNGKTANATSNTAGIGVDITIVKINSGLTVQSKVYDGSPSATVTGTAVLSGVDDGDVVTVIAGTVAFNDKNVGTNKAITFIGWSLGGANASNYMLSAQHEDITGEITAKVVTITGLTVEDKTYDGTTTATVSGTAVVSGTIDGDTVTATGGTAVFNDKNVGTNKAITLNGWSLGGADASNYTLSAQSENITGKITAKSVTITGGLTVEDKTYDGNTTATVSGTAVISGLINGDTVTATGGTATFVDADVGNGKTVTFSGWSLTGTDAGNYNLSTQPANVTANIVSMIEMVQINAGTFTMGSPDTEPDRIYNETQHLVTLTQGFYMGKYQVTQEQYQALMGSNPSGFQTAVSGESGTPGKLPVEKVNWYDAIVFCNKLSMVEGLSPVYSISGNTDPATWGTVPTSSNSTWNAVVMVSDANGYRLPTEAEWEYACRAGTTTAFHTGATITVDTGWYSTNSIDKTHQVGLKTHNAWGLYDMHGNVLEWCWDWNGVYESGAHTDPTGADTGTHRVVRGGCWSNNGGQYLRSAARNNNFPYIRGSYLGFRLVRSLP